tara:strand:- start:154 stop:594 length:441 start_codon:yes stop_codon:yes gene_type:complete
MTNASISIRKIEKDDIFDVIEILQQLSVFKPSQTEYLNIWDKFSKQNNVHSLVATIDKKIVGYGLILIVTNIRGGKIGHIEDIVSHSNYKNKSIGRIIVNSLFDIAKEEGCYKVVLQCKEHNIIFYEKCNYEQSGVAMQRFVNLES